MAQLSQKRLFLLDMDGTIYLSDRLFDRVPEFLARVRGSGGRAVFLTNNSSKSREIYVRKLRRLGVTEPFLRVYSSSLATGRYVLREFAGDDYFLTLEPHLAMAGRNRGFSGVELFGRAHAALTGLLREAGIAYR